MNNQRIWEHNQSQGFHREYLINKLSTVAPALSSKALIPALTHFWFLGKRVMAFNDKIAISTPLETEWTGAVPSTLLKLLGTSTTDEVSFRTEGSNLIVKNGEASAFKLPLLPPESFVFEMPELSEGCRIDDINTLLDRISICMRSVSPSSSIADQLGVTLIPSDDTVGVFSTNNSTLSAGYFEEPSLEDRVILSESFCKQALALEDDGKLELVLNPSHALLAVGETLLWGRMIHSTHPLDFETIIERHFPQEAGKDLRPVPEVLASIVERATIVVSGSKLGDEGATHILVDEGKMWFETLTERGHVKDVIEGDFLPASIKVNPKLVKDGLSSFDHFLVTDKAFILSRKDRSAFYLIGGVGS